MPVCSALLLMKTCNEALRRGPALFRGAWPEIVKSHEGAPGAGALAERVAANKHNHEGATIGYGALAECVAGDERVSGGARRGIALLLDARATLT